MVDSAIGGKTGRLKIRKLDRPITSQAVFIDTNYLKLYLIRYVTAGRDN